MHQKQTYHRDLKPENILLDKDMAIKIADLGFAVNRSGFLSTRCGTEVYMAPEVEQGQTYRGEPADIFSLGVILYILVRGTFPFLRSLPSDEYYNFLIQKDFVGYWEAVEDE
jgi:serine/threonine protein kinase